MLYSYPHRHGPNSKNKQAQQVVDGQPTLAPLFSMFSRNYNLNPRFNGGSR